MMIIVIENISRKLLQYLINNKAIEDDFDVKEYYQYGIEITISSILNIVLILLIGLLSKNFIESIIFLLALLPLTHFIGGYKTNKYFIFCLIYSAVLTLYNSTYKYFDLYLLLLIQITCLLLILLFSPTKYENGLIHKKVISILKIIFYSVIIVVLDYLNLKIAVFITYIMLLTSGLMVICIYNRRN